MILGFVRGLWAGLIGSSRLATWLMLAVAAAGVAIVALSPALTVRGLNVFPGIAAADDYTYAYMRAVSERDVRRTEPTVYLLGASTMRESLSSEKALGELVVAKLGQPVSVVDLTTSAQPLWLGDDAGQAAICGDANAVVLLQVSMRRARAFSPTDKVDEINWPTLGAEAPLGAFKARAEFLNSVLIEEIPRGISMSLRRAVAIISGRKPPQRILYSHEEGRHRYLGGKYSEERVLKSVRSYQRYLKSDDPEEVAAFFADIEKFADVLRACSGVEFVLVDTPLNPAIADAEPAREKLVAYQDFVAGFAKAHDMGFVSLPADVTYKMSDFIDHAHLRKRDAMERSTARLADAVVDVLAKQDLPANQSGATR